MPVYKTNPIENLAPADDTPLISWTDSLAIGIEIIDEQHKQLVSLTNELFRACRLGGEELDLVFKETMSRMVDYVHFHFSFEQGMLQRVKYPRYHEHKSEHDNLIKTVIETTKDYGDKKRFVPNNFVRFLKDWIVSHIGHIDKTYAAYIMDQKNKGLLSDKDING